MRASGPRGPFEFERRADSSGVCDARTTRGRLAKREWTRVEVAEVIDAGERDARLGRVRERAREETV